MPLYKREDHYDEEAVANMAEHYRAILGTLGEDVGREGLLKTPERGSQGLGVFDPGPRCGSCTNSSECPL